jgi:CheY-like chemotaxis protein
MTPRCTILVVDDEDGIREVLQAMLDSLGYATLGAATGVAALAVLQKKSVDAVLLDIAMRGGLDGVETLRAIKRSLPDLPVIMVTANADEEIGRATLREGAVDYVMKPLDIARLREVLAAALMLSGKEAPE